MPDETSTSPDIASPPDIAPPPITPAEISEEVVKKVSDLFTQFIDDLFSHTTDENSRLNAAFLSYLDRIVLLAGAALTLTFTVIANLGVHLQSIHREAHRPWLVMVCVWLFVSSIICGLLCSYTGMKAQGQLATESALTMAYVRLKGKVILLNPKADLKALEAVKGEASLKKRNYKAVSSALNVLTHGSLVMAFVFMALFVQANLSLLTT